MNKTDKKIQDYVERAMKIESDIFYGVNLESADSWSDRVIQIAKMIQLEEHN